MSASFKVDLSGLKKLAAKFDDPALKVSIVNIVKEKSVAAQIGQAIADNFTQHGPGWPPLKIREGEPLRRTNLLFKSVTTPGAKNNIYETNGPSIIWGTKLAYAAIHNKGGVITAKNTKMLFIPLTDKAAKRGPIKDKAARKKSTLKVGVDFIFRRSVTIPKREFLVIRPEWRTRLTEHVAKLALKHISATIKRGG